MPRRRSTPHVPTVAHLCDALERIAPLHAAAEWDNVGLLAGRGDWPARRVLLTIDLTPAVLAEAIRLRIEAIVSYHPPIFRDLKRLTPDLATTEGLAAEALSRRVAIYSPHTALDSAEGGTNDALANLASLKNVRPASPAADPVPRCKLVCFVPEADADRVAQAVFGAGAGRIGNYEQCSYRLHGQGTFFGAEGTNPVVGRKGRMERVDEVRLEVILPRSRLVPVVQALRRSHPYEEPAFDVYRLEPLPDRRVGQGRVGVFPEPVPLRRLVRRLVRKTRAVNGQWIGPASARIRRALICAGAAGSLPFEAPDGPAGPGDVVITGEIRHHDALRYARLGAAAIALGHWASERPVLAPLSRRLRGLLPAASIRISQTDRDPFLEAPK